MKKTVLLLFFLILLTVHNLSGQQVKYFQVDTIKSITGEILEIKTEKCYQNDFVVLYLKEKKSGDTYRVETAPGWFFNIDLLGGSQVEVSGSFSKIDNKNLIIAQSITFQGEIYQLRDKYGFPLWRGKGKYMGRGQQGKGNPKRRGRH